MKKIGELEELFIKENFRILSAEEMAVELNVCASTIYEIMRKLGIGKGYKWTPEKIEILKKCYSTDSWDDLFDKLGTTNKDTILQKASDLGIKRDFGYSDQEEEFIRNNYLTINYSELAKILGKSESAINSKINQLGLRKTKDWTSEELELLREVYPIYTNKYLSEKYFVGRKPETIRTKALQIGLHKTSEKGVKWYDKEKLLDQLKQLAIKLGRTPIYNELTTYGLPSDTTFRRYFGGYRNACSLVDLDINFSFFGVPLKDLYSKNGDFCFSYSEVAVTNFLIDSQIDFKKEQYYSNYIQDERCGYKRVDWILNDNTFVEYFGMPENKIYYQKMEEKRAICRENHIRLIEVFESDLKNLHIIFSAYLN